MDVQISAKCILAMVCVSLTSWVAVTTGIAGAHEGLLPELLKEKTAVPRRSIQLYPTYPEHGHPLRPAFSPRTTVLITDAFFNKPMERVVTFGLPDANSTLCAIVGSFFSTQTTLQSWNYKTFFSPDQAYQTRCICKQAIQPSVTSSPDRSLLVFYGFGTEECSEFIVLHDGFTAITSVLYTTGENVPWAFSPALVTIPTNTSSSMFTLISYGGSHCNDMSDSECTSFSTDIFQITIDISDTSVPAKWIKLEQQVANIPTPSPRSSPTLISVSDSELLLFGGVEAHEPSQPIQLRMLKDFWIFNIEQGTWLELPSDFPPMYFVPPGGDMNMMREFYNNLQAAYLSDYRALIVAYSIPAGPFRLYLCALPHEDIFRVHCEATGKLSTLFPMSYPYEMPWFSLLSSHTNEFHIVFHGDESKKSFIVEQVFQSQRNASQLTITQKLDIDVRSQFPGFQGCHNACPMSVPLRPNSLSIMYVFAGSHCPAHSAGNNIRFNRSERPSLVVWLLLYNVFDHSTIVAKYPSPSPLLSRSNGHTLTSVGPYMGILFGGYQITDKSIDYPDSTWCMYIKFDYLAQDSVIYWRFLTTYSFPNKRSEHVAFLHKNKNLVIQGGADIAQFKVYSDLWILQVTDEQSCYGKWIELTDNVFGEKLPRRYGHSATMYGDDIILFGGIDVIAGDIDFNSTRYNENEFMVTDHMLVMTIKNLSFIHLRKILLSRPLPLTCYHSLSPYGFNSYLLLGGLLSRRQLYSYYTGTSQAFLLQFGGDTANKRVKVIPFFNFTIFGHYVINNLVFSGGFAYDFDHYTPAVDFLFVNAWGNCPLGYGFSDHRTCQPCPVGYYSSAIGEECRRCPGDLTTPGIGAWKCDTICKDNYCHGHGTCMVDRDDKKYCRCKFGYLPADNCRTPSVYLSQLAAVIFSLVLSLCITFLVKFIRKRRDLRNTEKQMQIQHVHLQRSLRKLTELNRGARMQWRDVTISKRLASGTYSKVYIAKLSDMDVVVKKLPKRFNRTRWRTSPFDIFLEEAETLRSLRHPNIVLFLGAGQDTADNCPFLVMEYLRRGSLYDNLHDRGVHLEEGDMLRFALDIARGMRYLHSSNPPQIHRDLKSPNLLVSDKWVVKIGDLEFTRYLALLDSEDRPQSGQESSSDAEPNAQAASAPTLQEKSTAHSCERETLIQSMVSECRGRTPSMHHSSGDVAIPLLCITEQTQSDNTISGNAGPIVTMTTDDAESTPSPCFTASQLPSRVGMTCGVGTDRWRAPETLTENSYTERSDVYR